MKIKNLLLMSCMLVTMMSFKCSKDGKPLVDIDKEFVYTIDLPTVPTVFGEATPIVLKSEFFNLDSLCRSVELNPSTMAEINLNSVSMKVVDPDGGNFDDFKTVRCVLSTHDNLSELIADPQSQTFLGDITPDKGANSASAKIYKNNHFGTTVKDANGNDEDLDLLPFIKTGKVNYAYAVSTNKDNTAPLKMEVKINVKFWGYLFQ